MGNCLVTKLKGTVDNDSLRRLGEVEFTVHLTDSETPVFINVKGTGNNDFAVYTYPANHVTEVESIIGWRSFRLGVGDYKLRVAPALGEHITNLLTRINTVDSGSALAATSVNYVSVDTSELKFKEPISMGADIIMAGSLSDLSHYTNIRQMATKTVLQAVSGLEGSVSELNSDIVTFDLQDVADHITGTVSMLNRYTSLKTARIIGGYTSPFGGNIGDLTNVNLETITLNNNGVFGNFEDFVEAQISNNRNYENKPWCQLYWNPNMKIHNAAPSPKRYMYVHFTSTGAEITEQDKSTVVARYNKTAHSWQYPPFS